MASKETVQQIIQNSGADIVLNGNRDWDPQIKDERFYDRVLRDGSLGLGESYMDGWWDSKDMVGFFSRILTADLKKKIKGNWQLFIPVLASRIFNFQSKSRAFEVGEKHYDLGNDLYKAMLDKRMIYTCAYWKNAKTLDKAQEDKLDLVCKKLQLKKGEKVLDIGCGWGGFLKYAAENYGIKGVGITVSKEQVTLAKKNVKGLPIDIRLQDYRDLNEKFDKIVSLGMFEHVGYKNYKTFMKVARKNMKRNGLFLLHTIGGNEPRTISDPWIGKYIFPNSMIPSASQISKAYEGEFVMEDWHNFGMDYSRTLKAWHENFNNQWDKLKDQYDEEFKRMWDYYLTSSSAMFKTRRAQLWQIVLSPKGVQGGYESMR
mgnify:CR=1 FL=1